MTPGRGNGYRMKTAPSELFGRDREIAEIEAMLAGAAEHAGRVVVVNAGAGTGKTAVLEAAVHRARRSGFTVLTARGSAPERALPYGLVSRLFAPVVPEIAELPFAGPADEPSLAELCAVHRALSQLASQAPVLVAVDDLQWLDRQSLRWLSTLPQRVDQARIAVLLTICPGEPCADPDVLDELLAVSAVELRPAELSVPATSALIERTLAATPDRSFVAAVMREAGGNPLYVTELASVLRDQAVTPTADSAAVPGNTAVSRLASGVHARLRRISPYALDVARAVAVLGADADLPRVTGVCGAEPPVVMEVTTALSRAGLLRVSDQSVALAQPMLRNMVIQQVPYADLQTLRTKAVRTLRATGAPECRVAEQLVATPPLAEPWVVARLLDAAAAAIGRGDPDTAIAYLGRALHEPMPDALRTRLLTELGRAEGYVDLGAAIRRLTTVSERQAGVVRELAEHLAVAGRHQAAVEQLDADDQALCSAELQFDSEATAGAAAALLTRLPEPVKGRGDEGRHLSLLAMRTAWAGRCRSRAVALAKEALAVLPVNPDAMRPTLRAVLVLAQAGRTEEAHERCDALVGHALRWGHRPSLAAARSLRGVVAHRLGRMPAAAEDARSALELLIGCGAPRQRGAAVEFLARLVEVLVDLSDHDEAAGLLERSELCGDVPRTWAGTALLLARGRLRVAAGAPAEGLRDLLGVGDRLPSWKVENPAVAPWRSETATALLALGETADARRQAAEAVEQARRWEASGPLGAALRTQGVVTGGAQGLTTLEQSVSVLERSAAKLDLARSLSEYGTALSRAKRSVPARRALRGAVELAEECGCADLARRSRIELSASGGRAPKSAGAEGVAVLTAAELRTAMLAAEGRTNRELADILRVGLRTVEVHLTNAYRKLGIEGRDQLAAILNGHVPARTGSR